jgi:hypothetical protein
VAFPLSCTADTGWRACPFTVNSWRVGAPPARVGDLAKDDVDSEEDGERDAEHRRAVGRGDGGGSTDIGCCTLRRLQRSRWRWQGEGQVRALPRLPSPV